MGCCKRRKKDCSCNTSFVVMKERKTAKKPRDHKVIAVKTKKPKSKKKHVTFAKATRQSDKDGLTVTVRGGFDLQLPEDFFSSCEKRTTNFNINYLCDDNGQRIALKWVKGSHDCNFDSHMGYLVKAAEKTAKVLSSFAEHVDMRGWKIRVVKPLVPEGPKEIGIEPYIKNVEQFNSNTFWETDCCKTYRKLVLALAHFSYAYSCGEWVLTNLEGGVDEDERVVILLPPTVVSGKGGKYGCRDLGIVKQFCENHACNSICCCMEKPSGDGKCKKPSRGDGGGGGKKTGMVFEIVEE